MPRHLLRWSFITLNFVLIRYKFLWHYFVEIKLEYLTINSECTNNISILSNSNLYTFNRFHFAMITILANQLNPYRSTIFINQLQLDRNLPFLVKPLAKIVVLVYALT